MFDADGQETTNSGAASSYTYEITVLKRLAKPSFSTVQAVPTPSGKTVKASTSRF